MCYFTNDFLKEIATREEMQQKVINNKLDLDFYCNLKQLNLIKLSQNYTEKFIDAENIIRSVLAGFLILLNGNAFIKSGIAKSNYLYLLNEFSFELTLCENICNAIKMAKGNSVYIKIKFSFNDIKIIIYYFGNRYSFKNYCYNCTVNMRNFGFLNRVELCFRTVKKAKEKPSDLNLDGILKNRLSSLYISLVLSGLKRLN